MYVCSPGLKTGKLPDAGVGCLGFCQLRPCRGPQGSTAGNALCGWHTFMLPDVVVMVGNSHAGRVQIKNLSEWREPTCVDLSALRGWMDMACQEGNAHMFCKGASAPALNCLAGMPTWAFQGKEARHFLLLVKSQILWNINADVCVHVG